MASPRNPSTALRDSLRRIQTRLLSEEAERRANPEGSQSATLPNLRLTQIHEAKVAIIEQLLESLESDNGQEELRHQQNAIKAPTSAFKQRNSSGRVATRVSLQSIFTQKGNDADTNAFASNNPFRNANTSSPSRGTSGSPFLSELEKRRLQLIQSNSNKAALGRKAQRDWRNRIQDQANRRKEESLKQLNSLRNEREKIRALEEQVRERTVREVLERNAAIEAEAAAREAARIAAEEAERRAREIECAVCLETFDMGVAARLPCMHWYCLPHLSDAFEASLESRRQFRCCNEPVPIEILADNPTIQSDFIDQYLLMVLEQSTPNPVYCCQPDCGLFIPPVNARGPDEMLCPACNTSTCRHCKGLAHGNQDCPLDVNIQMLNDLAGRRGWNNCTRCNALIERTAGCSSMTCRCGNVFTYR